MESKEIKEHLDFMFRTTQQAARNIGRRLLPAIEEAYLELTKILGQQTAEEESRAAQIERLRKL